MMNAWKPYPPLWSTEDAFTFLLQYMINAPHKNIEMKQLEGKCIYCTYYHVVVIYFFATSCLRKQTDFYELIYFK